MSIYVYFMHFDERFSNFGGIFRLRGLSVNSQTDAHLRKISNVLIEKNLHVSGSLNCMQFKGVLFKGQL